MEDTIMKRSFRLRAWALCLLGAGAQGAGAQSIYHHGEPTDYEQLMLELVNRARADPAAEAARLGIGLNDGLDAGTISPEPKPPLAFHPFLIASARGHSQWMLDEDTFSHTGAGGSSPGDRMAAAGYVFSGTWTLGENIGWGGTTGTLDLLQQTRERHDALFISSGHRVNICGVNFRDVGLGILTGVFTGYNAAMVTQNFAASGAQPHRLLTGVVFRDLNGNGLYDPGEGIPGVTVIPGGGEWQAVTSSSGGYAVPFSETSGVQDVTFTGAALARAEQRQFVRADSNVKLDMIPAPYVEVVPDSLAYIPATGFRLKVRGTAGLAFTLQYSATLSGWTDVGSHTMGPDEITLTHDSGDPKGFYRLKW